MEKCKNLTFENNVKEQVEVNACVLISARILLKTVFLTIAVKSVREK
jgi:hypothetical protein